MASPSSDVDICNLALQRLGARSISALNENAVEARECNRVYEHARDSETRAYNWNFARKRASLAASDVDPIFGFAKSFPLPSDYLRLMPDNTVTDWQIEGKSILTDDGAPLKIVYLRRVTDVSDFDELFITLLVARIASDLAEKLTQSNTKKEDVARVYKDAQKTARKINGFENVSKEAPTDTWITARL